MNKSAFLTIVGTLKGIVKELHIVNYIDDSLLQPDLQYALENGIIDMPRIRSEVEAMRKTKALENHDNKIWQGSNGYWYTYVGVGSSRKLIRKKDRDDLIAALVVSQNQDPVQKTKKDMTTIGSLFEEWDKDRLNRKVIKKSTSDRNHQIYKSCFGKIDKQVIANSTAYTYQHFLETVITDCNLTAKGFSNVKTILKGILKLAKRKGLIDFSIVEMFEDADVSERQFRKVVHEDREEVFDEDEFQKLTEYCKKHLDVRNSCILLMCCTGLRVGEATTLKAEDLGENTVSVRRTQTKYLDKNGKEHYGVDEFPKTAAGVRDVVIPQEYLWLLKRLKIIAEGQEWVFMIDGKRMNSASVRKHLRVLCNRLGIYPKPCHKIRKTYGSILLDNNVDAALIRDQMGHASLTITEQHYHRNRKTYEKKEKILSQIPDFR